MEQSGSSGRLSKSNRQRKKMVSVSEVRAQLAPATPDSHFS